MKEEKESLSKEQINPNQPTDSEQDLTDLTGVRENSKLTETTPKSTATPTTTKEEVNVNSEQKVEQKQDQIELKRELEELRAFKAQVEAERKQGQVKPNQQTEQVQEPVVPSDTFFGKTENIVEQKQSNTDKVWEE
jgi:hypothetical protein